MIVCGPGPPRTVHRTRFLFFCQTKCPRLPGSPEYDFLWGVMLPSAWSTPSPPSGPPRPSLGGCLHQAPPATHIRYRMHSLHSCVFCRYGCYASHSSATETDDQSRREAPNAAANQGPAQPSESEKESRDCNIVWTIGSCTAMSSMTNSVCSRAWSVRVRVHVCVCTCMCAFTRAACVGARTSRVLIRETV